MSNESLSYLRWLFYKNWSAFDPNTEMPIRVSETFDSTDLDGNGQIVITHNKNYQWPMTMVVDDNNNKAEGVKVNFTSADTLTLTILGVGAFTGWRVEML